MANFFIPILGGKYKGKKLYGVSYSTTRSTKSIIKGSLFDTLQFDIIDKNFIEVFAGSGSIGLEAISRGAKRAYFIEKDKKAFEILHKNCNLIDNKKTEVVCADSFVYYPKLIEKLKDKNQKSYIYFDPPFDIREGMEDIYKKTISLISNTPKEVVLMIIIEHHSKIDFPNRISSYSLLKRKKFGKSSLSYFVV